MTQRIYPEPAVKLGRPAASSDVVESGLKLDLSGGGIFASGSHRGANAVARNL